MAPIVTLGGRYVLFAAISNLVWEVVQLPLYSIWQAGITVALPAAIHCTLGDIAIAAGALAVAALVSTDRNGSVGSLRRLVVITTILGIGYTVFSEWRNVQVTHAWSYTELMPTIPPLGTGLAPLLQWFVLPLVGFRLASRDVRLVP